MAKRGQLHKMRDGLVQRAEGRWSYVLRVPDERTGKTRQRWVSRADNGRPFPTRAAAKAARDKAQHELNQGTYVTPSQQSLGEYLTGWLDALHRVRGNRPARRASTVANYRTILSSYVLRHPIAQQQLRGLTRQQLEGHWDDVAQTGGKGGRALSERTVKYAHTLVKAALQEAVEDGVLARNPAARVGLPQSTQAKRVKQAWSPEQLSSFLQSTENDRLHVLWMVLAHTGMRRGEALALLWEDVDVDQRTARVHRAVAEVDGELRVHDTPKNRQERTVPLTHAAAAALRNWRKLQAEELLRAGASASGYVFTMPDGSRLWPQYATRSFAAAVRELDELPSITLHELRHTCGSLLLRSGQPVHLVAKLLGHDPAVLLSTYAHALPQDVHGVVDSFGELLQAQ